MNHSCAKPTFFHALLCIAVILMLVFSGIFLLKTSLHSIMLLCIFWVMLNAFYLNSSMDMIKESIQAGLQKSAFVFLFFILIGSVIAAFTLAGAIPTFIYYGLNFISPQFFLPIGLILCSLTSLAIGSCWGTIGTMGVALMGVATIFELPLPLTAGMIVSGAYFGDKFSPISDTTVLSALSTGTDLYKHIKGMTYSVIPAFILTFLGFWIIGHQLSITGSSQPAALITIQHLLAQHFHIGPITLLPMGVLLFLSVTKKPAEISMLVAVIVAIVIAITVQHLSISEVLNGLFSGPAVKQNSTPILNAILSRGGIQSMLGSMALTLLILVLGALLESYKFITTLFEALIHRIRKPVSLVFATLSTSIICNMLMGEAYLSIILTSRVFKQSFQKLGLDSCVLSKAVEEGSTFSTPLIPWTTSGAFICSTLGISPFDFLFWSLFNWVAPICFLIFVKLDFAGIKMYKDPESMNHRLTPATASEVNHV